MGVATSSCKYFFASSSGSPGPPDGYETPACEGKHTEEVSAIDDENFCVIHSPNMRPPVPQPIPQRVQYAAGTQGCMCQECCYLRTIGDLVNRIPALRPRSRELMESFDRFNAEQLCTVHAVLYACWKGHNDTIAACNEKLAKLSQDLHDQQQSHSQLMQKHLELEKLHNQCEHNRQKQLQETFAVNAIKHLNLASTFPSVRQICDEYEDLMRNDRSDLLEGDLVSCIAAKAAEMDNIDPYIYSCRILIFLLLKCYDTAVARLRQTRSLLFLENSSTSSRPSSSSSSSSHPAEKGGSETEKMWSSVLPHLRNSLDKLDTLQLVMQTRAHVVESCGQENKCLADMASCVPDAYLARLIRVCWKMVLCSPPLEIVTQRGPHVDGRMFKWQAGSGDRTQGMGVCLYPALVQGGNVLVKGEVCRL